MSKKLDMRKGSTSVLILSLLADGPMYGYQISKELTARSGGVFDFKEGTLYPALHRLEKDDLLASYWEVIEQGPSRKYYTITDQGRDALAAGSQLGRIRAGVAARSRRSQEFMPTLDDHLLDQYLDRLGHELQATPDQEQEILREIRSHLLLAAQDLGRGREVASQIALERFGEADEIGQALRHVHGRARWGEALLAALPVCLLSAVAATPQAPDWIATLLVAAVSAGIIARTLLGHTHCPLWGWAWLGCLPLVVPNAPPNPLWGGLAYLVVLLLVRHRNWIEATLALYPLPTAWAFHRTVLVSHDVALAGWSATGVSVLGFAMAALWAGLLIRPLRTPSGPPRIARVLEALGTVFLLNTLTVAAGRLWPTNLSPYPYTLSYLVFVTVPYALFNGLPYLLFTVLTALPAILAWATARTRRRPPSRPQWTG